MFFDVLGVEWEYEPEGLENDAGERYLPDFCVTYPALGTPMRWYFEVKPYLAPEAVAYYRMIARLVGDKLLVLDGAPCWAAYYSAAALGAEVAQGFSEQLCAWPKEKGDRERPGWILWSRLEQPTFWLQCASDALRAEEIQRIANAIEASRGARFEFGDAPV